MNLTGGDGQKAFEEHLRVIQELRGSVDVLQKIVDRVVATVHGGGRIYILGNGGSAADAQHIAAELVGRFKKNRRGLPAVALTTDTSSLTAISNDLGAEQCFSRQVEALVRREDLVWALSVSGRSPNILRAMEAAKTIGAFRVAFTSVEGSALSNLCDLSLRVAHTASDRVQEAHEFAYHLICGAVEEAFA